ncbi:MAG: deoxyribodipyrimidine photo-lyase [Theionarchaea archaeon]|nr:deoxyribodipyrimidine photo-lyase [Theionarchaea archaeon]MBU7037078.1 deoxyribodipyrimidine photo-lyase [Theionarchaea archaeon]
MIHTERIQYLNTNQTKPRDYVMYWMQSSHRTEYNHALEYAIIRANELHVPVVVFFCLTDEQQTEERHYRFMLEGLKEVKTSLEERNVQFVLQSGSPPVTVPRFAGNACLVVVDRGYLRKEREWQTSVASHVSCPVIQVETNVVVPVEVASPKEEYSAATFRPKIERMKEYYLVPLEGTYPEASSMTMKFDSLQVDTPSDMEAVLRGLNIGRTVQTSKFKGGTESAKLLLQRFIREKIDLYLELRNDPTEDYLSNLSPYLHFGQISPVYIALKVSREDGPGKDAYLEQLLVRRELSMNFVFYNSQYDQVEGLPQWARKTLKEHEKDPREYLYTPEELEAAETHDPYWNAAQNQMVKTGKMHGYMRMYWGKKILEWSPTPETAYRTALMLNDRYELDGRDPNGYTGVAWCFGKHDRPWKERPIFGTVRFMTAQGLRRKFDVDAYVRMATTSG